MPSFTEQTYSARAAHHTNPTAKRLLNLMDKKQSNLSVAVDVNTKAELLDLADKLGPLICVLKTHIDVVNDFDMDLVEKLKALAEKHQFMIFEDRKFADIGNTVKQQYSSGVYRISSWADITNAHPLPGEGIVHGLREVGLPLGRGLLLLAEMSSAGSLAKGSYTTEAYKMATRNRDFVFGFIGQRRLDEENSEMDFVYMTPGVQMAAKGDALGQQYRTPEQVITESKCDVIIVGRGIYRATDPVRAAEEYRKAGWDAYLKRVSQK
ncbi:orotidine 5'-phosphate decarboxylase [Borealophlyctis nickersoniae]|nr:orotidine 5'-phosphate decarboxylase [Borealophlyctis nickersoniae]